tara:strand:- start:10531 stop:10920 length:390 start_codon:yes stop_codon:yes gene_type:complete
LIPATPASSPVYEAVFLPPFRSFVSTMPRLAHQVFFTTKDRSDETINALLDDCQTYLNDHPGLVGFAVGRCEPDYDRPVNMDFDVVLHTVFEDRAAHDAYQTAPRHLEFIERQKPNWAEVRVFDSNLRD